MNKSSMLALGRRLFGWSRSRWWSRKARKPRVRFSECVFLYLSNIDNPYSNPTEILYTIAPNVAFGALHPITTKLFAEFCPPRNPKFCKGNKSVQDPKKVPAQFWSLLLRFIPFADIWVWGGPNICKNFGSYWVLKKRIWCW